MGARPPSRSESQPSSRFTLVRTLREAVGPRGSLEPSSAETPDYRPLRKRINSSQSSARSSPVGRNGLLRLAACWFVPRCCRLRPNRRAHRSTRASLDPPHTAQLFVGRESRSGRFRLEVGAAATFGRLFPELALLKFLPRMRDPAVHLSDDKVRPDDHPGHVLRGSSKPSTPAEYSASHGQRRQARQPSASPQECPAAGVCRFLPPMESGSHR